MKIYLIRHAETVHNTQGRYYGDGDVISFTERGERELQALKMYFENLSLSKVVSSPTNRCIATAQHVSAIPVQTFDELEDLKMGIYKGMDKKEILQKYPDLEEQRLANLYEFVYPEGESHKECEARVWNIFEEIVSQSEGDIAIVTHAAPSFLLIKRILHISFWDAKTYFVYPGSVSIIEYNGETYTLKQKPTSLVQGDYSNLKSVATKADGISSVKEWKN